MINRIIREKNEKREKRGNKNNWRLEKVRRWNWKKRRNGGIYKLKEWDIILD